ncbi:MAG: hypothetical protein Q9181_002270 [Wetmoreana brouardii]
MQQILRSSVVILLTSVAGAMAQSTANNPLNEFIGAAHSAVGVINSANAKQTTPSSSSSSTSPTQAAATSASPAAAAHHSGTNKTTLIVAIVCAIVGALLIALLLGLCCWCLARRRRRRRRRTDAHAPIDDEVKTWRSNEPKNPGRDYSPRRNSRVTSMEQQPMIPPVAKVPAMQEQHPAFRNQNAENPFVPVPPSPRRTAPNSRAGLTDGNVPGAAPYIMANKSRSRSRSSSRPRTTSNPNVPLKPNTASQPSTPFGLSGVGQPYEDMHVHVLQTDSPSRELRQSLHNRDPIVSPPHPIQRYDSTPPTSSYGNSNTTTTNRHSAASIPPSNVNGNHTATNSSYETSSTEGSTSADDWRYNKASTTFGQIPPWEQRQYRYSNGGSSANTVNLNAPPIPWSERESKYNSPSHSPRQSRDWVRQNGNGNGVGGGNGDYVDGARRNSRSPATSINGQPRRLRFSDLQADEMGYGGYPRHSQGVGEAL